MIKRHNSSSLIKGGKNKQWFLGDKDIKETKAYNYLGTIINHHLKDNEHINNHLATKAKTLDCYICFTLAKHMDINRIHFGDTIWRTAVQPRLSHAAGVWFDSSKQTTNKLQFIQYQFTKAVLKIKYMPSKTSTLGKLGWLPIKV